MLTYYSTATDPAQTVDYSMLSLLEIGKDEGPNFKFTSDLSFVGLQVLTGTDMKRRLLKQVTSVDFFAKQDPDGPFEAWLTDVPITPVTDESPNNGCTAFAINLAC